MGEHHLSWISHLFRAFWAEGVRHIYISPGSRSTPLVQAAAGHPGFQKHVVLDERSAAFQALGTGKATGIPALLICTSGTAVANYHPAVIEAGEAGVPLLIISADRPPHLRGTGSSQTIDQVKLFGDAVIMFHELGEPVHSEEDYRRLTLLAHQSVTLSRNPGGAVHLNAPFRKPLEAGEEIRQRERERNMEQIRTSGTPHHAHGNKISHLPEEVTERIKQAKRPLLIAGPDEPFRVAVDLLHQLSMQADIPVIAEPGSHLPPLPNLIHHYDLLLRSERLKQVLKPDLIIRTGDNPVGACFTSYAADNRDVPVLQFLSRPTWQESTFPATDRVHLPSAAPSARGSDIELKSRAEWLKDWKEADAAASQLLTEQLERESVLTDGHVIRHFTSELPYEWGVMTSNSFTIRDLALFGRPEFHPSRSFANRGAAGIDGILSTAAGSLRATGRRTALFIGDLAFLHDAGALASVRDLEVPLLIIVFNNGGGTIFRMLPVYSGDTDYTTYFETPQGADLGYLAKAYNVPFRRLHSIDDLPGHEFIQKLDRSMIIECVIDADLSMALRNSLWQIGAAF